MIEPLKPPHLKGTETVGEAVALLSEGNPGAIRVFMSVMHENEAIKATRTRLEAQISQMPLH